MKFILGLILVSFLFACKPEVTPCNCSKNLMKTEKDFDYELDELCDAHLESLNEKDAQKWTDSMMNCISESK
jgi:hypothetical protein